MCCCCRQTSRSGSSWTTARNGHMIDNVVLIVTGTLHERDVHVRSLLFHWLIASDNICPSVCQQWLSSGSLIFNGQKMKPIALQTGAP